MQCRGSQGMGADRLLLVVRALARKNLVFSILAVVDVIVGAFAIPNLVMTERHDARMRHGLLAGSERIVERQDALDPDAFCPFAREFCFRYPLVHLPQFMVLADGLADNKDLPEYQQSHEYRCSHKDPPL